MNKKFTFALVIFAVGWAAGYTARPDSEQRDEQKYEQIVDTPQLRMAYTVQTPDSLNKEATSLTVEGFAHTINLLLKDADRQASRESLTELDQLLYAFVVSHGCDCDRTPPQQSSQQPKGIQQF